MRRYRVLSDSGASYGEFSSYAAAVHQAEYLASPERRHQQGARIQSRLEGSWAWKDEGRLLAVGLGKTRPAPPAPQRGASIRARLSSLSDAGLGMGQATFAS